VRTDRAERAGNTSAECESKHADSMHLEYFADTLVDSTVQTMLAPYVAQKVG
jgi:hypothetical protein